MEKNKQKSLLRSLKEEIVRGLSLSPFKPKKQNPETLIPTRPSISTSTSLEPLLEGPEFDINDKQDGSGWIKRVGSICPFRKRSDLRLLLGVLGAPLGPVCVTGDEPTLQLSIKNTPIESSFAQYILQQYIAASGGQKLQNIFRNAYAMGKFRMLASEIETAARVTKIGNTSKDAELGGFVLWQMNPGMWFVELAVGGSKVRAGCNGKLVWRHTPWLGAHTAKGPPRPLRRALQGLDPRATASMFANARCIGEKKINGESCFILKISADPQTLKARSEGLSEIIRHIMFGYFSQKTGLLVHLEDSHLTRIQASGGDAAYWETTINSSLDDYKPVEGIMIAHSGRSVVSLFRFGEVAMSHTRTRMEEAWTIDEVAFNVPGLSVDCFIPPSDLKSNSLTEGFELQKDETIRNGYLSKVAILDESMEI